MAKAYSHPKALPPPTLGSKDYVSECEAYTEKLREWCRRNSPTPCSKLVGEVVRFPIADGYAEYVVYATKPLSLVHVNVMDGYQIPNAHLRGVRVSDIRGMLKADKAMARLFREGR